MAPATRPYSALRASETTSRSAAPGGTFERTDHVVDVQSAPNIASRVRSHVGSTTAIGPFVANARPTDANSHSARQSASRTPDCRRSRTLWSGVIPVLRGRGRREVIRRDRWLPAATPAAGAWNSAGVIVSGATPTVTVGGCRLLLSTAATANDATAPSRPRAEQVCWRQLVRRRWDGWRRRVRRRGARSSRRKRGRRPPGDGPTALT
jgi:hypothetical protein